MMILALTQAHPAARAGGSSPGKHKPCRFIDRVAAPVVDLRSARQPGLRLHADCYNRIDVRFVPH